MNEKEKIRNMFIGFTLADAIGVPFEFKSRSTMARNPANSMEGFGTYGQPKGTWSDDSSLALCLADSLCNGYDLIEIAKKFVDWSKAKKWTARGIVFDIGWHTRHSLDRLENILKSDYTDISLLKYETDENTNGNGSLMRILPLLYFIKGKNIDEQFAIIKDVSALTHGHIRSALSCMIYLKFAEYLTEGNDLNSAYLKMKDDVKAFFMSHKISEYEVGKFARILENDISKLSVNEINSEGYVIDTLEASFWCLLTSSSYTEAVFKSINLGGDTDTTATVVGGIAGYNFGLGDVPKEWFSELARYEEIVDLSELYAYKYLEQNPLNPRHPRSNQNVGLK